MRTSIRTRSSSIQNVSWDHLKKSLNVEKISGTMHSDLVAGTLNNQLAGLMKILYLRQCPGMHLVDSSAWLLIVCMMSTLNIKKPLDENGKVIEPNHTFDNPVFRLVC